MDDKKELKILLLEDNLDDVSIIEHVLRKENLHFTSQCVDTREEFNDAIRMYRPDVVLSDHGLPGFNSREALKICLAEARHVPFILVTGTVSEEYAVSCLHDGADDYILKSNLSRLPTAIVNAVKKRKIERLKRKARLELKRQNIELLKVNKELDSFVYSVSHNLRGPLASVMGLLSLTTDQKDYKILDSLHGMMATSISKLDETISEILEYYKNARNDIQVDEIDWSAIIQSSLDKLDYLDKDNRVRKNIYIKSDIPFYSDATRIYTIFSNLLSNAITYSDCNKKSFVTIKINTTEENAFVSIQDNGIGIRDDIMPKIFNMFYRGTELSRGAGLGLYTVKETIAKLKGEIEITSAYGRETTVNFKLPQLSVNS
jgi:signal transduction histidine kinase